MKIFQTATFWLAGISGAALLVGLWLFFGAPERVVDMEALEGDAARGAYVLRVGGCVGCHTVGKGAFLAGGPPLVTPFGIFYGPNLTSDPDHGLGAWSGAAFAGALVNGHSARTGSLFPVFPFTAYSKMSDKNVADLWAYLQSVEPNATPSRPHALKSPLIMRILMRPWRTLFHRQGVIPYVDARSASWNRGRYLVEGPGHCGECHTPRGLFGALDKSRSMGGGALPRQKDGKALKAEKVPALTPKALDERGYDKGDLMMAFQFGLTPDGDVLGGSMGEVLSGQLEHLTRQDLEAIADYLLEPLAH